MRISHIAPFAVSAAPAEVGHERRGGRYGKNIYRRVLSVWQYLNDTISYIEAVMEGFNSDGANCYEKYIPSECKLKTSK